MADLKITQLPENTSPILTDIFPMVDDPSGVPATQKVTLANIKAGLAITKSDLGLGNVDNVSDVNKPVSTQHQTALNTKQDNLISGTNIKTINGTTILGSGDISVTASAHASSHITGGSDIIPSVISGGNSGLMSGVDKNKLDGIASGAEVNVNPDWNAASGDAQILNKPSVFTPANHTHSLADVTNSGSLAAQSSIATAHIADDQVTFAKIQNLSSGVVLGRGTIGSGDAEELTLGANMTLIAGVLNSLGVGGAVWSSIAGALSSQTDLQAVLDMKQNSVVGVSSTEIGYLDGITSSVVSINNTQALSNKTIVTPSIASFAQAQHTHQNGTGGGLLNASSTFSMTGGQIQTSVLGTGTADNTTYLRGDSTWATPTGGSDPFTKLVFVSSMRTGANTAQDLSGMSFSYATNSNYSIDIYGRVTALANTTGVGFGMRTTTAVPVIAITTYNQLANTGTVSAGSGFQSSSIAGVSSGIPTASTYVPIHGGGLLITGSVAGTAQFQIRSEVSGGSIICGEGTMFRIYKMG